MRGPGQNITARHSLRNPSRAGSYPVQFDLRIELKALSRLAHDADGDVHPPGRSMDECFHGRDLANDQNREGIEVNLVNPVLDDEIADHGETNQRVYAGRR